MTKCKLQRDGTGIIWVPIFVGVGRCNYNEVSVLPVAPVQVVNHACLVVN